MSARSPGPWALERRARVLTIHDRAGKAINVHVNHGDEAQRETAAANARLMAAAPELYRLVMDYYQHEESPKPVLEKLFAKINGKV